MEVSAAKSEAIVTRGGLAPDQTFPLVIRPRDERAAGATQATEWAAAHRDELEQDLLRYGAILFRGFDLGSASAFERFALSICSELFNENGEHPREAVSGKVYTPVFYPPEQKLLWHNENSFNLRWPMKILFGCARPADEGGDTPIVDSRRVFEELNPELRRRFIEKQLLYQRNFGLGVGLDWQAVFQTDDKAALEEKCRGEKIQLEWKKEGGLRALSRRPAAARHPKTGEWTWFNQAQHWHISCLDPETREALEEIFAPEDLPRHCFFGDESTIEDSDMQQVMDVYDRLEVSFLWQVGDVLLLDNMLTAHARNPFKGERKILVAMGEMLNSENLRV